MDGKYLIKNIKNLYDTKMNSFGIVQNFRSSSIIGRMSRNNEEIVKIVKHDEHKDEHKDSDSDEEVQVKKETRASCAIQFSSLINRVEMKSADHH